MQPRWRTQPLHLRSLSNHEHPQASNSACRPSRPGVAVEMHRQLSDTTCRLPTARPAGRVRVEGSQGLGRSQYRCGKRAQTWTWPAWIVVSLNARMLRTSVNMSPSTRTLQPSTKMLQPSTRTLQHTHADCINVIISQEPRRCTYLALPSIVRQRKVLETTKWPIG